MPRTYLRGEIVGEPDPPVPFAEWLRREIERAEKLDDTVKSCRCCVHQRRGTLREVLMAWEAANNAQKGGENPAGATV